jgi:beta-lactamase regulating signal transducer with metallopeptidase domain
MYELLGISVVFAALLLLNAAASLATALAWRLIAPLTRSFSARTQSDLLFTVRLAAPVSAAIVVAVFLIPSYLDYEPRATAEAVSPKLAALALLSAASVAFALWRTIRSWLATAALRKKWLTSAKRIQVTGINVPAFRISHRFPIIAIVGCLRPQLFIAGDVLSVLTTDEMAAAIAHECGHLAARDNLKRTLLHICRDSLFLVPFGRAVDRLWAETAESAADEFAARQSPAVALSLASALVRIAKMVPAGARADVPLGAYLVGAEETQGVKSRIRRLIEISSNHSRIAPTNNSLIRLLPFTSFVAIATAASIIAANGKVLMGVHLILERAVSLLS